MNSVAVSPDGRRIVSGSKDRTVAVWDLETGTPIHRLKGHQDRVMVRGSEPRRTTHRLGVRRTTPWWSGTSKPARVIHRLTGHQVG